MDPHRGLHLRLLGKRQGLSGVIGGLVPQAHGSTPSPAQQSTASHSTSDDTGDSSGLDGILGGVSSLIGNIPSLIMPSSGPSTTTSITPLTPPSSSSTGSTPTPTSSVPTTTPTSSSPSASIAPTTATPTSTPTPSVPDTIFTSSDGTRIVYVTNTQPAASPTTAHSTSFLQDPSLEGGVFTLIGLAVLIIAVIAITCTIRKRRRNRLERDLAAAVTFDPSATDQYERQESSIEKHRLSGSSSGHGHGHGYGYGAQPSYAAQQDYHGPVGYGQYPAAVYRTPSSSIQHRVPSPTVLQPAGQDGANLKRKFSDRKPVPPLLVSSYDPSNTHVSVPPQLYHQ